MIEQYVYLGQRVELETVTRIITDGEPQQLKKVYSSKVFDILSAERLEILMPYEQRKLVLLPVDSEYTMYFYVEGAPNKFCIFATISTFSPHHEKLLR